MNSLFRAHCLKSKLTSDNDLSISCLGYPLQHAKKVVSDSLELVDFAIGLVNSVINLHNGQVKFF